MSKSDERAQLEELRRAHMKASDYAAEMLQKFGEDSPQFGEADRVAAEISGRIDKLEQALGSKGK